MNRTHGVELRCQPELPSLSENGHQRKSARAMRRSRLGVHATEKTTTHAIVNISACSVACSTLAHGGAISRHYGGCVGCPGEYDGCLYVIDHVAPLLPDDESRNCLANLQPLCFRCNLKKKGRTVDWRKDKGAWILETFPYASAVFKLKDWVAMMPQEWKGIELT